MSEGEEGRGGVQLVESMEAETRSLSEQGTGS